MNNETLDKAVIELNGVWPKVFTGDYMSYDGYRLFYDASGYEVCVKPQFTQRSKELGFINGYRWGVEYPTNGKRPELADDVVVEFKCATGTEPDNFIGELEVSDVAWTKKQNPVPATSFRITDHRYEPADTSYIQTPAVEAIEGVAHGDWYDYENQKALRLPDVGEKVELWHDGDPQGLAEFIADRGDEVVWWNIADPRFQHGYLENYEYKPLDHATRKAELEKNRVVDAAFELVGGIVDLQPTLESLYDAGYLRLPANKD